MTQDMDMDIKKLIELFQDAERIGDIYDDPEGSRYICISDTLAKQAVTFLKTLIESDDQAYSGAEPKILFFDTETSGFINKNLTYDDPAQAWCIQIGAILSDSKQIYDKMDILIKPAGRTIHPKAQEVHGISAEYAEEHGYDELEAANSFGILMRQADMIVCHNYDFDWTYVYQMMQRNIEDLSDEARSAFYLDLPHICTMKDKRVKDYCGAKNKAGRIKWPKLIELHEKLFDCGFDDAHDAFADIKATRDCFYGLINRKIIEFVQ